MSESDRKTKLAEIDAKLAALAMQDEVALPSRRATPPTPGLVNTS
jgi:hypothetical protein